MANAERYLGYQKGNRVIRRGVEEAAGRLTRITLTEESRKNLQEAVVLWENGMDAAVFPNHESDADGAVVTKALRLGGAGGFSDAIFVGMGDKILRKKLRGFMASSYPHIPLPQVDSQVVKRGSQSRREMLQNASNLIPKLMEEGYVFFTFPEGTRSLDGTLAQGRSEIAHYLSNDSFVLPVGLDGTREAWPKEKMPNFGREIKVGFGKPILIADVNTRIDDYEKSTGRRINKNQRNKIIIDTVMRHGIAPLIPLEGRGQYTEPVDSIIAVMERKTAA